MTNLTPAALSALVEGDMKNFIAATTPGGIEAQEAEGQRNLVNSTMLPKEINTTGITHKDLENLGFIFGADVDDLFVSAILPVGWRKVATESSYWTEIFDDKGRLRAEIFYKAAFYDRSAHLSLRCRFRINTYHAKSETEYECVVIDSGQVIQAFGSSPREYSPEGYALQEQQRSAALAWLNEHYPDWQNPLAYWD